MSWKTSNANGLCISILLNKIGWYLGVIEKLHKDQCLFKIFTGKVENVTTIILIKHCLFHGLKN